MPVWKRASLVGYAPLSVVDGPVNACVDFDSVIRSRSTRVLLDLRNKTPTPKHAHREPARVHLSEKKHQPARVQGNPTKKKQNPCASSRRATPDPCPCIPFPGAAPQQLTLLHTLGFHRQISAGALQRSISGGRQKTACPAGLLHVQARRRRRVRRRIGAGGGGRGGAEPTDAEAAAPLDHGRGGAARAAAVSLGGRGGGGGE